MDNHVYAFFFLINLGPWPPTLLLATEISTTEVRLSALHTLADTSTLRGSVLYGHFRLLRH